MRFYHPKKFKAIEKVAKGFIPEMVKTGKLGKITKYELDCIGLCHEAVNFMLENLKHIVCDISVIVGTFNGCYHVWLRLDEYYLDPTLAQFEANVPNLAITKIFESLSESKYAWQHRIKSKDWKRLREGFK